MAKENLAQYEQYLKQLEQHLEEIGDQYKLIRDSLRELQININDIQNYLDQSLLKILNLLVLKGYKLTDIDNQIRPINTP